MYTPREEFARMGVGSRTKAWRYTDINKDYGVRPQSLVLIVDSHSRCNSSALHTQPNS